MTLPKVDILLENHAQLIDRHTDHIVHIDLYEDNYHRCASCSDRDGNGYNVIDTDEGALILIVDTRSTYCISDEDLLFEGVPEEIASLAEYAARPIVTDSGIVASSVWWAYHGEDFEQSYGADFDKSEDDSELIIQEIYEI